MIIHRGDAARGIVIKNDMLLVIKRIKNDKKYMVLPGGHIEAGEDPSAAVVREIAEETTVRVSNPRLVYVEDTLASDWGTQYIYLCEYTNGKPVLPEQSEEYSIQQQGGGTYIPLWFSVETLPDDEYPFLSAKLGEEIKKDHTIGFQQVVRRWQV